MLQIIKFSFVDGVFKATLLCCLIIAGFHSSTSYAGAFSVLPVRVYLEANQSSASLEISNRSKNPVTIQAQTFDWTQVTGQAELTPTADLIVSPPIFQLAPESTQTIRLALVETNGGVKAISSERSFRLILEEVPMVDTLGGSGVRIKLRMSLPVFVAPTESAPLLDWQVINNCTEPAVLQATNSGTRHAQIVKLTLRDSESDAELEDVRPSKYVLAGESMQWPLQDFNANWPDSLTLATKSTTGSSKVDVAVNRQCDPVAFEEG